MPSFICSHLNYSKCANLHAQARDKSKGKPIAHNAAYYIQKGFDNPPVTGYSEGCYWLKMYHTNILVFFADGALRINDHNSPTTTAALNELGPVRVFSDSHIKFSNKRRFGHYSSYGASGVNYPMPDVLDVSSEGVVQNTLVDFTRKVRPECRAERRQLKRQLKDAAFARLTLGEFPQLVRPGERPFWQDGQYVERAGFYAVRPSSSAEVYHLLLEGADHELIDDKVKGVYASKQGFYLDAASAANKVIDTLVKHELQDPKYFYDEPTHYVKGEVRAW